ncbi:hypothetical protein GSUET_05650 [Geobacter sulfurreducens subsp. ethanolicus]|uniref:Uncharacterized protein n=1 Tax=Geomobilimonas luticola TaxID=1114878 RepID=A0ABS5SAZ6_9BACT|nr:MULTISPECIES: hypothetical protein [Geobacteraceae]MBT0652540.1 hypothetical protein [Geomobilimonas luticola]BEH08953.1 hypothetical protein GSUET_05650 [Geobacter sulfurreducens subsp. ethanolicus]
MKGNEQINKQPDLCLSEEHFRMNDVLSEQIAIIQEFAPQLDTGDLMQLKANLVEIEKALNRLKEFMAYLPKQTL